MTGFGAHEGHTIHPHDHRGQDHEHRAAANWCSKRYLCTSCTTEALPRGVWIGGPECEKPPAVALNGRGGEMKGGGKR